MSTNDQDRFDYEVTRELQELAYGKADDIRTIPAPLSSVDAALLAEALDKLDEYMRELQKYDGYVLKGGEKLVERIADRLYEGSLRDKFQLAEEVPF